MVTSRRAEHGDVRVSDYLGVISDEAAILSEFGKMAKKEREVVVQVCGRLTSRLVGPH